MSNLIPSREERLRRAHESAERTKKQWENANDVYEDVRDVITQEDPQMDHDFIWPEAVERRSAETINLEEQAKAWDKEVKRFKEINMRYDQEIERFGDEIQSSQITDDEPDNITQHRLKCLVEGYPRLATLLFQDDANVQPAIQNIKQSGNELISKLHNLQEEVQQIWVDFKDARKDYHGRLDDIVKPLQKELAETQDQLDSAQTLQSTTDAELTKVREKLQENIEQRQISEKTLQDEIDKRKAEISELKQEGLIASRQSTSYQAEISELKKEAVTASRQTINYQDEIEECKAEISQLKREAVTASRQNLSYQAEIDKCKAEISQLKKQAVLASSQNISYQTEIGKLKSEGATTIRYLSTELESVTAENVRAKAQNSQHKAEIQAMTEAQNSLSTRNDEREAEIKILEDTVKEVEETLSQENDQLQVQIQTLNADKDALSSQNSQYENQIHGLETAKDELTIQKSEIQAKVRALVAEKDDLTSRNEKYQAQIRILEVEKAGLTSRNEENQSQIQTMIQTHQLESELLETANSELNDQINDLQEAARTMQLENHNFASQIEDLTTKNQSLVINAEEQSRREQQHSDRIAQLTVEIENCDENLWNAISEADEERRLNLEDKQQLQRVLFSNVLSLQGDKDGSLLAAGTRLFFK